jgi:phosphoesterase RecJ-like protein
MSAARREALEAVRARIDRASRIVLTSHINPDGDGVGSMVALADRLRTGGTEATIVTPSKAPASLRFAFGDLPVFDARDPSAGDPLKAADLIVILDTAERHRVGAIGEYLDRTDAVIIDHHPATGPAIAEPAIRDASACATGELIFDMLSLEGLPLSPLAADAIYIAIATDTGSFQFSNTTARTHQIASELVNLGVDPEAMYRRLYGTFTRGGLSLVRLALETLEVDPLSPVAWVAVDHNALRDCSASSDDMEGLVEYPRRLAGIEVGLFFRGLSSERTKVSLRSNGDVNVSEIAQKLGGGGHEKASGIVLDMGLEAAVHAVLERVRPAAQEVAASG